jgi:2-polyprenyl-3-methyl-5-hydroxy-6-metoxy-1,4-benzoquinol methylase
MSPMRRSTARTPTSDYVVGDLTGGYPEIPSEHYDVVVCEQVLEHLAALDTAIATLVRVLRPAAPW